MENRQFDKDDVLRYVYGELPQADEVDFIEAMCADEELFSYYQELKETQNSLEEIRPEIEAELQPSEFVVSQVLNSLRETSAAPHRAPARRFRMPMAAMGMVAATLLFMVFTLLVYQTSLQAKPVALSSTTAWDMSDLDQRLQMARLNADNLNGDRTVIAPVYSNTYRLIRTGDFAPTLQNVVLLSIE
jgi:hypothetical protein